MSFSQKQKADIIHQPIRTSCCKKSFLQGILSAKGSLSNGKIVISVESAEVAEYVSSLILEVYSKEADSVVSKKGGRRHLLEFCAKSAERYVADFLSGDATCTIKCDMCRSEFLRGVFLAAGRVSDPEKQYSLEFSVGEKAERFCEIFSELGLTPRISVKKNETTVYFRNSGMIEDFFALAGMNQTAFDIMNAKIQAELRNNTNRIVNCETNNIDRAVSASMSQIALISELIDKGLISLLPDELERTARFRMENKDMSLAQMAGAITPPISKSGLSHRLKKITELAESILKGNRDKI